MTSTALDLNNHSTPAALEIRPGQQHWTEQQQAALNAIGVKNATRGDLDVFFHYCQKTGLDPFSKQIYMICRNEKVVTYERGQRVEQWVPKQTIQVGIDGFRIIRDRACRRDGIEVEYEDTFWYDRGGQAYKVWLEEDAPAACSFAVLKNGKRYPAVLTYREYVQKNSSGQPTGQWREAPAHQLEKCAEAFALRRAFPHDLGGVRLEDEPVLAPRDTDAPEGGQRPRGRVTAAEVLERQPARQRQAEEVHEAEIVPGGEQKAPGANGGEQEAQPALSTGAIRGVIGRQMSRLGYTDAEAAERTRVIGALARRPDLTDVRELTQDEAQDVAAALKGCGSKADVTALLDSGEKPGGEGD